MIPTDNDMKVAREIAHPVSYCHFDVRGVHRPECDTLTETIVRTLASQREQTLTEIESRARERDYDAGKIVGEIAAAIRAGKKG